MALAIRIGSVISNTVPSGFSPLVIVVPNRSP